MLLTPSIMKILSFSLTALTCTLGVAIMDLSNSAVAQVASAKVAARTAPTPHPLTAEEMAKCVNFSRPVRLRTGVGGLELFGPPRPLWSRTYTADKQTLYSYSVELYRSDSAKRGERAKIEKSTEKSVRELKKLWNDLQKDEKVKRKYEDNPNKMFDIQVRPSGRKVYMTGMMMGPGGGIMGAFTTIGKYDLLLLQITDSEDDMPQEKRLKNPAEPRHDLLGVFEAVEKNMIPRLTGSR